MQAISRVPSAKAENFMRTIRESGPAFRPGMFPASLLLSLPILVYSPDSQALARKEPRKTFFRLQGALWSESRAQDREFLDRIRIDLGRAY